MKTALRALLVVTVIVPSRRASTLIQFAGPNDGRCHQETEQQL